MRKGTLLIVLTAGVCVHYSVVASAGDTGAWAEHFAGTQWRSAEATVITKTFSFDADNLQFSREGDYSRVTLAGCRNGTMAVGSPDVPTKDVQFVIPPGTKVAKMTFTAGEWQTVSNVITAPVQPPSPTDGSGRVPRVLPNAGIYEASQPFPEEAAVIPGQEGTLRGWTLVTVRLQPLQSIPAEQILRCAGTITIALECVPIAVYGFPPPQSHRFMKEIQAMVENKEDVALMPRAAMLPADETVEYLLITSAALSNAFDRLVIHRSQAMGVSSRLVTIEEINAAYDGTRPDGGNDIQTKIRNCIIDYVNTHGTVYVALGGDDRIVPDRDCIATSYGEDIYNMPTDLYYAGLDGSWDQWDNDGIYGEYRVSGINGQNEFDQYADVYVGRIPVRTEAQANIYIDKVLAYETVPPYELAGKYLMCTAKLFESYTGDDRPADYMPDGHRQFRDTKHPVVSDGEIWMREHYRDTLYAGRWPSTRIALFADTITSWDGDADSGTYLQNDSNVRKRFNEDWQIMTFYTHGGYTGWGLESGGFDSSDAISLTNLTCFVHTMACLSAGFEKAEPCLSEAFLRATGGALVYMGCSRVNFGGIGQALTEEFLRLFAVERQFDIGRVFYTHKLIARIDNEYERWVLFGMNLQGDPALQMIPCDAHTNHVPEFVKAIILPGAQVNTPYSAYVGGTTFDWDMNDTATFAKVNGPAWLEISADGSCSGIPGQADLGKTNVVIGAYDGRGGVCCTTSTVWVVRCDMAGYSFEQGMTTTVPDRYSGYDADLIGNPQIEIDPDRGQVLRLNGESQYIKLPHTISHVGDFTYSTWIRWGGSGYERLFTFRNSLAAYAYLRLGTGGDLQFRLRAHDVTSICSVDEIVPTGVWSHIALVFKGNTATIYYNGGAVAATNTFQYSPLEIMATNNYIGYQADGSSSYYFDGLLDDVRFYSYALSPAAIHSLCDGMPVDPDPAPGTSVPEEYEYLCWIPSPYALTQYVRYAETVTELNSQSPLMYASTNTCWALPAPLEYDQTNYWRIDTLLEDGSLIAGDTWHFMVIPEPGITGILGLLAWFALRRNSTKHRVW